MKKKLPLKRIGNLVQIGPNRFRDLTLHKEALAVKLHGRNWRKELKREEARFSNSTSVIPSEEETLT